MSIDKNRVFFTIPILFFTTLVIDGCKSMGAIAIPVEQLEKRYGSSDDKYIAYEGMNVRYRDEGHGPVLILLHGICSFLETWDGWVKELKGNYRIIRMDMPGFGMTGPASDKRYYSRDAGVELLDAFVKRLGVRQVSLAGNSLGGYIAWNYALKYPQKVRRLILIDPIGYNQKLPWLLDFASSPAMRSLSRRMMPRSMLYKAVKQVYGDKSKATPKIQKRYFDFAMREGNKSAWVDIFIEMRTLSKSAGLSKDIHNIRVPTLVMWGKKDEWIPSSHVELWKKDLPSASFITYGDAGHIPMDEIPEKTARDALKFLR